MLVHNVKRMTYRGQTCGLDKETLKRRARERTKSPNKRSGGWRKTDGVCKRVLFISPWHVFQLAPLNERFIIELVGCPCVCVYICV